MFGWSEGFKQKLSLGRRNNRKFVSIPMRKIVDDLTAKLAKARYFCAGNRRKLYQ